MGEAELDIAKTLYEDLGRKVVGDEDPLIDSLGDALGGKVTERLKRRRAMRNRLARAYLEIDQAEVYGQARDLNDVKEFEKAVVRPIGPGASGRE